MLSIKLAIRNILGAGLRTWLNVIVLSISYFVIIWHSGMLRGWYYQARSDTIAWEIGAGQYWHDAYDPFDVFTLADAHGDIPESLMAAAQANELLPILITQGTVYPQGRMQNALVKGIPIHQSVLEMPTAALERDDIAIPAIIGTRMAKATKLKKGDRVTLRWRDANGTFDAADIEIVELFHTNVPAVDNGQIWLPLSRLQGMLHMPNQATLMVAGTGLKPEQVSGWKFQNTDVLMADFDKMIKTKSIGGSILYMILMMLAMLAIFDTQVLSIFRRQKEIGTIMALGMTRFQVVRLFTIEGAMHGLMAAIVAAIYGIPLLTLQSVRGISMPKGSDEYGIAIADKIFPVYSAGLIIGTICIVMVVTTIVSFLPTRRIAKMNPTDAIRGKIQ